MVNLFQDKTNPSFSTEVWLRLGRAQASLASALALHKRSLVTGWRCKPYTRNPFDYSLLCELVLG